jgi:hypothetical protein
MAEKKPTLHDDLVVDLKRIGIKEPEPVIREFDLLTIPAEAEDLVRETAKKVQERIDSYARLLEDLLQPDTSLAAMNECSFFSDQEMENVVRLYRQLIALLRKHTITDIDDQEYGRFITGALAEWAKQKPALQRIAKKLQSGWEQDQPLQREKGYFG